MSHGRPPTSLPFVTKPERVLDLGPIDVKPFASAVLSLPESFWAAEDDRKENRFEVFHSTQHAVLPSMRSIVAGYAMAEPELPKAMFARLMLGAEVTNHNDSAASNLLVHKIHVPTATTTHVRFIFQVFDKAPV